MGRENGEGGGFVNERVLIYFFLYCCIKMACSAYGKC